MWSFWKSRKKPQVKQEPALPSLAAPEEAEETMPMEEETLLLPQRNESLPQLDAADFCVEQDITLLASSARLRP